MASNARNLSKLLGTSTQVPTTALPQAIADLETIGTSLSGGDIAPKNISSNTLTQSFDSNQTVNFIMSDSIDTISPIISVFKEVSQPGISSKGNWDVNANATNYEFFDEKPISYSSISLTPSATGDGTFTSSNPVVSGYVIANASLDSDSFDPSSQETSPQGLDISPDGTKLIVVGATDDALDYYTLSTPFDLSSATHGGTTSTINSNPYGCRFSSTGHKIFVSRNQADDVYEIPLSTNYDASTAGAFQSSGNLTTLSGNAQADFNGIHFSSDGTKMFSCDEANNKVHEYTLSTAWDITTLSYVHAFDISSQDTIVNDLAFTDDGTRMFILGSQTGYIYEYGLTQAWDVSSASYSNISLAQTNGRGMTFSNSGQKMYLAKISDAELIRYSTSSSTAFNSSDVGKKVVGNSGTAVITSTAGAYKSVTAFADTSTISSWQLFGAEGKSDGTGISLTASASGAFNVSGASDTGRTGEIGPIMRAVTGNEYTSSQTNGAYMKPDGTQFFINYGGAQNLGRYIYSVPLTTAYDISTVTSTGAVQGNINTDPSMVQYGGIFISPDGTKLYFTDPDYTNSAILQYNMSTAWAVNTMSLATKKTVTNAYLRVPKGIFFSQDGTKMFLCTVNFNIDANGVLHLVRMTLSTAWDLSTAGTAPDTNQYIDMSNVTSNGAARITGAGQINSDGTKIVFVNSVPSSPEFVLIELSTPYDLTTATFTDYSPPGGTGYGNGAFVIQNGLKAYLKSGSTSQNFYHEYDIGELAKVPYNQYSPALTNSSNGQINSSTWLDINSMTADETKNDGDIFYAVSTDNRTSWGVAKASDGVRKIARNNSGTWQYNNDSGTTVTVGFDIANASYDSKSLNASGYETFLRGVDISSDGQHLIITGSTSDDLHYYTLSTAFDVSTASYVNKIDPHGTVPTSCRFSSTGHKVFICDGNTYKVESFDLSTAYDLSTASSGTTSTALTTVSSNAQTTVFDFNFNNDGTKMFSIDRNGYKIHEYTLSTAWDITNLTYVDAYTFTAYSESFAFSSDGTKLFILNQSGNDKVELHNLSVAFDISTASISSPLVSYDVSSQDNTSYGICFGNNGQKMYIAGSDYETVYQYSTGSTTVGYSISETWVNGTNNNEHATLQQALGAQSFNRMNKAQLDAVADGYHFSQDSADTLDLMIAPYAASGESPISDGVTINYDAEALVREAVAGTDYIAEFPSPNRLDIKSLINGNLKIRAQ